MRRTHQLAAMASAEPQRGGGGGGGGERQAQPREGARPAAGSGGGGGAVVTGGRPYHGTPYYGSRGSYVFVGGYFYDPFYGPYPWWPRSAYGWGYYPVFDYRADIRIQATPKDAAVYVDGFYAGVVDDFDGNFQRLPLTPGGHRIELFMEGFRTVRKNLYLQSGSTLKMHETLVPLAAGETSEPPEIAPPVPAPATSAGPPASPSTAARDTSPGGDTRCSLAWPSPPAHDQHRNMTKACRQSARAGSQRTPPAAVIGRRTYRIPRSAHPRGRHAIHPA